MTTDATAAVPARLANWRGTDRYAVRRFVGAGSMGTVYEAFDRERGQPIAIKRLRHFSPAALYLFKQEFRGLVDVVHPNLVRLYELVATDPRDIFFSMELVRGTELLPYVRSKDRADPERLRAALRQLVDGVQALHAAGKLHRDIKPSNVLVTPEGRVVLLDFGVATEMGADRPRDDDDEGVVGTVAYMAPEQAAGAAATAASDWYSVGAILYEALTGRTPLVGSAAEILRSKGVVDVEPPSQNSPHVPPDLDALCSALLQRSPMARPSGPEILRWLGIARQVDAVLGAAIAERRRPLFGRGPQLELLRGALKSSRKEAVTVLVGGPSGMGKSALVQEFLDELGSGDRAVVLRGRAYERESVPYKAIDSWIDALSRYLLRASDQRAGVPIGEHAWALARLFPVLRRVPEIADTREQVVGDPARLRRLGFRALRELLVAIGKERPLVVSIDDAHWGDADSAALLLDLLRPPEPPPVLLVMTYRNDERGSVLLHRLRSEWPSGADLVDLTVEALELDDARALAGALLGAEGDVAERMADDLARESGGSPFLIEELARTYRAAAAGGSSAPSDGPLTLERSVSGAIAGLPAGARRILELVAVGGRPLSTTTLAAAAGLSEADEPVETLRAHRFVRAGLRGGQETVEILHARIGDAIVASLPPERVREHHAELARVLEATAGSDPESVALHLVRAGQGERAAPFAERAAEDAIGKVAFDQAAQMFRLALDAQDAASESAATLRVRLADALAWAGRGPLAAKLYLEAAERTEGLARLELQRAGADALLGSGRIDEGGEALRKLLGDMGTTAPRSTVSALFWLAVYRMRLVLGGLRFKERDPKNVLHGDRVRIDTMFAVAFGFSIVDVLLGACMLTRCLLLALRAGDRDQILRAAVMEAGHRASAGGEAGRRERELLALVRDLAARSPDASTQAFVDGAVGVTAFLRGRWKAARRLLDSSTATQQRPTSSWHANGHIFATNSCYFTGELRELVRRHARVKADAAERGDLYTIVNLATTTSITAHLVAGQPDDARRQLREAMKQWSHSGFLVQQWQAMVFEPDIEIYSGDGAAAYDRFSRDLPELVGSFLRHVQFVRAMTAYAHARCAIASIESRPALRERRIAEARRCVRRIRRERMPWIETLSATVTAATENAAGNREACRDALLAAIASAERTDMGAHALAARHRLGEITGGDAGAALAESARQALRAEGARDPLAMVAIYLPGRWTG